MKRPTKYKRCKKCKELVNDSDNCANCANRDPFGFHKPDHSSGQRGRPTLDVQEGNVEEMR